MNNSFVIRKLGKFLLASSLVFFFGMGLHAMENSVSASCDEDGYKTPDESKASSFKKNKKKRKRIAPSVKDKRLAKNNKKKVKRQALAFLVKFCSWREEDRASSLGDILASKLDTQAEKVRVYDILIRALQLDIEMSPEAEDLVRQVIANLKELTDNDNDGELEA